MSAPGRCTICGRALDTGEPEALDCGGDCRGCMAASGDPDALASLGRWRQPPVVLLVTIAGRVCAINGMVSVAPPEAWQPVGAFLRGQHGATLREFTHRVGLDASRSFELVDRAGFLAAARAAGIAVREFGGGEAVP